MTEVVYYCDECQHDCVVISQIEEEKPICPFKVSEFPLWRTSKEYMLARKKKDDKQ